MNQKILVLPLSDQDIKRIKRATVNNYVVSAIFSIIGIGSIILLLITFTDPGFRSPDSYIVACFIAFIGTVSFLLVKQCSTAITRLKGGLSEPYKKIYSGELIKIERYGSVKIPRTYWTVSINKEYHTIYLKVLDNSAADMKELSAIKEGDIIEMQQYSDWIILSIKKIKHAKEK
jgi:hypothetical protein